MKIDHSAKRITYRQSSLGTLFRCPEEARRTMLFGDWTSDEAFIGTVAHAGIEADINGDLDPHTAMEREIAAVESFGDLKWTKRKTMAEVARLAEDCYQAWREHLWPHVYHDLAEGAFRTEESFKFHWFDVDPPAEYVDRTPYEVWLTGTVDLAAATTLWDWKTSSQWYEPWEKQRWAIQPTVYWMAAVDGCLTVDPDRYDHQFNYGVMIKPRYSGDSAVAQHVVVERDQQHADWLEERVRNWTHVILSLGEGVPWPQVDDNHLCSPKWCDHHADCKGRHLPTVSVTPPQPLKGKLK